MPRPVIDDVFNLDDPHVKRRLMSDVGRLQGLYRVELAPKRSARTTQANAYYWAAVVAPFFEYLKQQSPAITQRLQAHEELKRQILGSVIIPAGKAICQALKTTHDMDVAEFMDYVERARVWLRASVGIETLDPEELDMRLDTPEPEDAMPAVERR